MKNKLLSFLSWYILPILVSLYLTFSGDAVLVDGEPVGIIHTFVAGFLLGLGLEGVVVIFILSITSLEMGK